MLRLRTLGGLALECDGARLESVAGRRRALALLAQLAVAGPRGVSRAKLVHRLWPDSDEEKARNVLAQTLHKLKRDLAGAEIVTGASELRLDDALISSDVGEFERHSAAGQLDQAGRVYDGPFLDGFYVNGADEFERWAEDERSRLARLAAEVFEALAQQADRAGEVATAVAWWRRLAALDPLATRATLGLMTALATSGDTADSLRVGSLYQSLVRNELGAPPDPAVERLTSEIRSGVLAPLRRPVGSRHEPTLAVERAPPGEPNEYDDLPVDISLVVSRGRGRRFWYVGVGAAVVAATTYASIGRTPAEAPPPTPATVSAVGSLAVLPLVNLDRSTADDYFADGVAEELAMTLSRVPGLRVAAHTSAFAFKGVSADAAHMASALGVQTLLEGSVRRTGRHARIALRLVNGFDGFPLMSADYEWDVDQPLALQQTVAAAVADSLPVSLPRLGRLPGPRSTADPLAHDLYLRGRFEWNKRTPAGLSQAVTYFRQAVARDTTYAAGYAGLADALVGLSMYSSSPDLVPQAEIASHRAIRADPSLGEAHVSLAMILDIRGDGPAAEREYALAVALNPSYAPAHHWHAFELEARGHHAEAMDEIRAAYALDPLSPTIGNAYGAFLYLDRDWQRAITVLELALSRASDPFPIVLNLAAALTVSGRDTAAITVLRRLPLEELDRPEPRAALAIAHWRAGYRDSAQSIIRRLSRDGVTRTSALLMASVYAQTGDADSAFASLARVDWRRDQVLNLRAEPLLDPLRRDPRFVRLLDQVASR